MSHSPDRICFLFANFPNPEAHSLRTTQSDLEKPPASRKGLLIPEEKAQVTAILEIPVLSSPTEHHQPSISPLVQIHTQTPKTAARFPSPLAHRKQTSSSGLVTK